MLCPYPRRRLRGGVLRLSLEADAGGRWLSVVYRAGRFDARKRTEIPRGDFNVREQYWFSWTLSPVAWARSEDWTDAGESRIECVRAFIEWEPDRTIQTLQMLAPFALYLWLYIRCDGCQHFGGQFLNANVGHSLSQHVCVCPSWFKYRGVNWPHNNSHRATGYKYVKAITDDRKGSWYKLEALLFSFLKLLMVN